MIRVNDRMDPMSGLVEIPGAELADTTTPATKRAILCPQGEFTARLSTAGAATNRFTVVIGDPDDTEDGVAPDMWFGMLESWAPAGSKILIVCRPARSVEEIAATLLPAQGGGAFVPPVGGLG